jgi:carbamoyltransferase
VALNVKLNQRIIAMPDVKELFVQPAASDAGTAIGAASYASEMAGVPVEKMDHVYLGPSYTTQQCIDACEAYTEDVKWQRLDNTTKQTAEILNAGNPVSWFQGRMEFGPRALGNRSILGSPNHSGVADRINAQIKYRERWRPFCPSMLDTVAAEILQTDHPSPYMTFTFDVAEKWKNRIPEVVHEDGTARAQIVTKETNPRYYSLLDEMEKLTGNGVVLNTSLNRRGEPMVCSPEDALNMFFGSDLEYLVMEDILVTK